MTDYREHMKTTDTFVVSVFDGKGLPGAPEGWFVFPEIVARDSGILSRSNFETALSELGGEGKNVEVHRFGHWGPGWFKVILINPCATDVLDKAVDLIAALKDYPVLCDEHYSDMELEAVEQYWDSMGISERIGYCEGCGMSPFAARHGLERLYSTPLYGALSECIRL